jgi:uncharacterized protein YbjQ (UPF0145 family)
LDLKGPESGFEIREVGRVAPDWDLSTLHTDMKWDAGVGLRGMFGSGVGRLDFMFSEEDFAIAAMVNQAADMGADAIFNVRYMTTSVVGTAAELFAYGTAVKFDK